MLKNTTSMIHELDLHLDNPLSLIIVYFNLEIIALVKSPVDALPPKSPVICLPSARVSKMAFSMRFAWSVRDMWRSIMMELGGG